MRWRTLFLGTLLLAGIRLGSNVTLAGPHGGGGSLDYTGGPDAGGYAYVDNVAPDTATFDWVELRGEPGVTWISSWNDYDGGSCAMLPIGFHFPYYGTLRDSLRLSVNGVILFTDLYAANALNPSLPTPMVSGPAIVPYWDNLHLQRFGSDGNDRVGYKCFGDYTVIEYDSVAPAAAACVTQPLKFEVLLFNDGRIKFQYHTIGASGSCANTQTIGIQSRGAAGSPALVYAFNTSGHQPFSGLALWFYPAVLPAHDVAILAVNAPLPGFYAFGQVLSVTAQFFNWGTTAESTPVKYSFDGGAVVDEATAVLTPFGDGTHTFTVPVTLPGETGSYTLTVWSDLANDVHRANDTARVILATNCIATPLTGSSQDSATFNNCASEGTFPPMVCGASYQNVVFSKTVEPEHTVTLWQSSNSFDSRHSLRWGGACPGTTLVDCADNPDEKRLTWRNSTDVAQTAYLAIGGASSTASCGDFILCWQDQVCAEDLCVMWLVENFESVPYVPTLPACWTMENVNGDDVVWESYGGFLLQGTKTVSIGGAAITHDDWLFTPALGLQSFRTYSVDYMRSVVTAPVTLEIKAGLAPTAAAMTVPVTALEVLGVGYQHLWPSFSPPTSDIYYIGFHDLSAAGSRLVLDEIRVEPWADCYPPQVTALAQAGVGSVTLTASAEAGSAGCGADPWAYNYQWYTGAGCSEWSVPPGIRIPGATTAAYTTTESGIYFCAVWRGEGPQSICCGCDSALATVLPCDTLWPPFNVYPPPYATYVVPNLPVCWSQLDGNADGRSWQSLNEGGAQGLYLPPSVGTAANDWLFSQAYELRAGIGYSCDYRYRVRWPGYSETLELRLGTARDPSAMTTTLDPVFSFSNTDYMPRNRQFQVAVSGTYYFGWHCTSGIDQGGVLLDEILIATIDCCFPPWNVLVEGGSGVDSVVLRARPDGGVGEFSCCPAQFRWYRGALCDEANRIPRAADSLLTVFETGDYACAVYDIMQGTWSICDSAHAVVTSMAVVTDLVAALTETDRVMLRFITPLAGLYRIYSTTDPNNDGDPRFGDSQWVEEAVLSVTEAGAAEWTDPAEPVAYKNFVVVRIYPPARD